MYNSLTLFLSTEAGYPQSRENTSPQSGEWKEEIQVCLRFANRGPESRGKVS